ncbi:hypothetical protein NDU88_005448 [Pleurodeles waltl]|uniref:Uncharacterized protein n=1 Tax=Pleurodeles waltl TaxID=8319 RepID=A0AAV7RP40_PLEWA|nr:hypothetical protein NDU88_005448 [Pleurodeles waltl]
MGARQQGPQPLSGPRTLRGPAHGRLREGHRPAAPSPKTHVGAPLSFKALGRLRAEAHGAVQPLRGPGCAPRPRNHSAPRSEGPPGKGPSRGPGRLSCRSAAPPQLRGRTLLSPRERRSPNQGGRRAAGIPRGCFTI